MAPPPARFVDPEKPDFVPGIASVNDAVEKRIRIVEYFELSGRATERGMIFHPDDGSVLYDQVGKRSQVVFPLRLLFDKIATHNHPSGQSFSSADLIAIAADGYLRELRVIGRPAAAAPTAKIRSEFRKHTRLVERRLDRLLRQRAIPVENATSEHLHQVWTSVAKALKFQYTREALD
jgi:hypothetical protein